MADQSAGGSASLESESRAHTRSHALALGGVFLREDQRVEVRRSLVDAGVPSGG